MEVFRSLMATRRLALSERHVQALNLVEIEFYKVLPVLNAWNDYFSHLSAERQLNESSESANLWANKSNKLLTELLHEMATFLNFGIEQLEIFDGGYTPQDWANSEWQVKAIRFFVLQLLRGDRPLYVAPLQHPVNEGPYPPTPKLGE